VTKAQIVIEIVLLLQGTPVDDFARHNLAAAGNKVIVRCAETLTKICRSLRSRCRTHCSPFGLYF